ncbi:hypothetical protein EVAR_16173_1 [Eumeta japonica]|uniref:Uncharacterized protein n=1 Tax=Eumeta variegata TaxID=151549 RepID=A0A4C1WEA2_EUMVA|nr:hypothetical protein EVAR_16173_1 [Eumeta japonica]
MKKQVITSAHRHPQTQRRDRCIANPLDSSRRVSIFCGKTTDLGRSSFNSFVSIDRPRLNSLNQWYTVVFDGASHPKVEHVIHLSAKFDYNLFSHFGDVLVRARFRVRAYRQTCLKRAYRHSILLGVSTRAARPNKPLKGGSRLRVKGGYTYAVQSGLALI